MRLIDLMRPAAAVAPPGGLFLLEIHHRRELDLSLEDVDALADVCDEYDQAAGMILAELVRASADIDRAVRPGREITDLDREALAGLTGAYQQQVGRLLQAWIDAVLRGSARLDDAQLAAAVAIRRRQDDQAAAVLSAAMDAVPV